MRLLLLCLLALAPAFAEAAEAAEPIVKPSPHSVAETVDRLDAAVKEAGATVFARVDHAEGAERADMELRPATLLVFGNPKLGTPLMQADIAMGLELPLRVLVYEGEEGGTTIAYADPRDLAARHDVEGQDAVLDGIADALDKLTSKAAAAR